MNKERVREIIFGMHTKAGKQFDIILLFAIIISVIGVILSSDLEIEKEYGTILYVSEWIFSMAKTKPHP